MSNPIETLHSKVLSALKGEGAAMPSRTSKLWREGKAKMAKKLIEEAGEVALDAVLTENKPAIIQESADLLYHLSMLWVACDIEPHEVWAEMERRDALYGLAEKLAKPDSKSDFLNEYNFFKGFENVS